MANLKNAGVKKRTKANRLWSWTLICLMIVCAIIGLSGRGIEGLSQESPESPIASTETTPPSQLPVVSDAPATEPPEVSAAPTESPEVSFIPTEEPTLESELPVEASPEAGGKSNNNLNSYDNPEQQETEDAWVLNTRSMKIHYPSCRDVKKISPKNYSTSNLTEEELIAQGYSTCGTCH